MPSVFVLKKPTVQCGWWGRGRSGDRKGTQCGLGSVQTPQEEQLSPGEVGTVFQRDGSQPESGRACGISRANQRRRAFGQRGPVCKGNGGWELPGGCGCRPLSTPEEASGAGIGSRVTQGLARCQASGTAAQRSEGYRVGGAETKQTGCRSSMHCLERC